MKNRMMTVTTLCVTLMATPFSYTEDKNSSVAVVAKKETPTQAKNLSASEIIGNKNIKVDATIAFVDSFAIMGECQEGQKARKDIESKRDLATQELQDESKEFEKAKNNYVAKSTTMSDSAREKEEKRLMKMERDLKSLVAEKEEELKLDMQLATETLAQGLEAGVTKLAKNEKLDVVFDKMTGRAIYVSEKFDFTTKAITEVNKNYEVKLAQNKQAESATKVADNKAAAPKPAKVGA
ncbi:MAG TPA: OmpH family outer membrane protein [Candidatus Babeliales bacterium]|nr:OmpH family outer membrane protein [Candidatus Babeliales bacterium]